MRAATCLTFRELIRSTKRDRERTTIFNYWHATVARLVLL